jgi:hypothetical protein
MGEVSGGATDQPNRLIASYLLFAYFAHFVV